MRLMVARGVLQPDTIVWTPSFGPTWKAVQETSLAEAVVASAAAPPPPPRMPDRERPPLVEAEARAGLVRRPAAGDDEPTKYASWLAFLPLLFVAAEVTMLLGGSNPYGGSPNLFGLLAAVIVPIVLAWRDSRALSAAGFNPHDCWLTPFVLLTPFGYFWRRAAVTKTSYSYMWIWLGCFVVQVLVVSVLVGAVVVGAESSVGTRPRPF
jgi:hypothetical protein